MTHVSAITAARTAGCSYRQLDTWTSAGLIHPMGGPNPGSGQDRRYDPVEVRVLTLMTDLVRAGVAPPRAEAAARGLLESGYAPLGARHVIIPKTGADQ